MMSLMLLPLLLRVKAGPDVWLWETKVSPAGSRSDRATAWASLGPLFVSVIVYVRLAGSPAMAVAGPVLVTARSLWACTVVEAVELLLPGLGSVVLLLAVAVLLNTFPSGTLGLTCATTVKLAEAPAA